jgi:hypothetical protein
MSAHAKMEDDIMIIRTLDELKGTNRATTVAHGTVGAVRYLLRDDGAGFSVRTWRFRRRRRPAVRGTSK